MRRGDVSGVRFVRAAALVAAAIAVSVVVARAGPDDAPATTRRKSPDGHLSLDLPSAWTLTDVPLQTAEVLAISASVPGGTRPLVIEVQRLPGMRSERGQTYSERPRQPKAYDASATAEVRLEPTPHLVMNASTGGRVQRHLWVFRILERCGYTLHVVGAPEDFVANEKALVDAARSMTADYGEWPERPAGYRCVVRDGFEYLLHPAVKDKQLDAVHRLVLDNAAAYERQHGPIPKPDSNRAVVVVHAKKEDAAAVNADAATSPLGNFAIELEGRVFTVPPPKGNPEFDAEFARAMTRVFHYQCFADSAPDWLFETDTLVAWHENLAGKPLPAVAETQMKSLTARLEPFDKLVGTTLLSGPQRYEIVAYAALFRCGAKPWKDAYAAFLKELTATGDVAEAQKKHLLSLDQDKLRAAAEAFAAKELKSVKGR